MSMLRRDDFNERFWIAATPDDDPSAGRRKGARTLLWLLGNIKHRGRLETCPYESATVVRGAFYALPASFNPRNTFSGLNGKVLILTPVALQIALAIAAIGGTQAISPAPLAP